MNPRRSRMRFASSLAGVALLVVSVPAAAQGTPDLPPPAPPPPSSVEPAAPAPSSPSAARPARPAPESYPATNDDGPSDAPKARKGFQLAVRTGVSVPLGKIEKGSDMSDAFAPQVPVIVDIGGKIIPELFLGGYLGIAVGGTGGRLSDACDRANFSCVAVGFRIGVQAQYHLLPAAKLDPWIGYGIGYEAVGFGGSRDDRNKISAAVAGVEFAHLMAGLDFRLNRTLGIGPFADFAIGQYTKSSTETTVGGVTNKVDGDVRDTAMHQWLTLGVKFTFFP